DVAAQLLLVEVHAGGRITAELALLVAVASELQITEIRHRALSSSLEAGDRLFLQCRLAAALARFAPGACLLDERLHRCRLRRRESRSARRRRLERLAVAPALRRLRAHAQHLRLGVVGPRPFAQRLQLLESLIADEVDVRAIAAVVESAVAAAQRLAPVSFD